MDGILIICNKHNITIKIGESCEANTLNEWFTTLESFAYK